MPYFLCSKEKHDPAVLLLANTEGLLHKTSVSLHLPFAKSVADIEKKHQFLVGHLSCLLEEVHKIEQSRKAWCESQEPSLSKTKKIVLAGLFLLSVGSFVGMMLLPQDNGNQVNWEWGLCGGVGVFAGFFCLLTSCFFYKDRQDHFYESSAAMRSVGLEKRRHSAVSDAQRKEVLVRKDCEFVERVAQLEQLVRCYDSDKDDEYLPIDSPLMQRSYTSTLSDQLGFTSVRGALDHVSSIKQQIVVLQQKYRAKNVLDVVSPREEVCDSPGRSEAKKLNAHYNGIISALLVAFTISLDAEIWEQGPHKPFSFDNMG